MRNIILLLFLLQNLNSLTAQIPQWSWAKSFGGNRVETIEQIEIDSAGNAYVTGSFRSSNITIAGINYAASVSQPRYYFIKYNTSGAIQWAKVFPSNVNWIQILTKTSNSLVLHLSYYGAYTLGDSSFVSQNNRTLLVNYNLNGGLIWYKHLFPTVVEPTIITHMSYLPSNEFIFLGLSAIGGVANGITINPESNIIGKMNGLGQITEIHNLGGWGAMDPITFWNLGRIVFRDLKVSKNGKIYISGYLGKYAILDSSTWILPPFNYVNQQDYAAEAFIACFSPSFDLLWSKVSDLQGTSINIVGSPAYGGMHVFDDESVVIGLEAAGFANLVFDSLSSGPPTTVNNSDVIAAKFSSEGVIQWVKRFDSNSSSSDGINSISGDALGNSYLGIFGGDFTNADGSTYGGFVVSKINSEGNVVWHKGSDNSFDGNLIVVPVVKEDQRGNVFIAGGFSSLSGPNPVFGTSTLQWVNHVFEYADGYDAFIARLNNCEQLPVALTSQSGLSFCEGDSILITATGGPLFYWNDGVNESERWISDSNTYTVFSFDSLGCYGQRDSLKTTMFPNQVENKAFSICLNDSVLVNDVYYAQPGNYQQSFLNQNGCDSLIQIQISAVQIDTSITEQDSYLISNQSGANYQWLNCSTPTYSVINGATDSIFYFTQDGFYAVAIEQNGCRDTSNCIRINTVGIENISTNSFSVYPNPADEFISISSNEKSQTISIYNSSGQLIYSSDLNQHQKEISVKNWANGIYILKMGAIHSKITIQH